MSNDDTTLKEYEVTATHESLSDVARGPGNAVAGVLVGLVVFGIAYALFILFYRLVTPFSALQEVILHGIANTDYWSIKYLRTIYLVAHTLIATCAAFALCKVRREQVYYPLVILFSIMSAVLLAITSHNYSGLVPDLSPLQWIIVGGLFLGTVLGGRLHLYSVRSRTSRS